MSFLEELKLRAKKEIKTIVLPEASDIRTLQATDMIIKEGLANIVLVGNKVGINKMATENGLDISKATVIDPTDFSEINEYANMLFELRKAKGMTIEQAKELVLDEVYLGMLLVKNNKADGLVSGAIHSTADTLRPALQIIKTAKDTKTVSTFFLMIVPNCKFGDNGVFVFSDCALVQNPTSEELAEIAKSSAKSFNQFTQNEPKVAMLSHSTKGSAKHNDVSKVIEAAKIVKEQSPNLKVDGEFQLDAAIVPSVGQSKAPDSSIAGNANVLIFPDLDAGNIGYKLVQRLANAEAFGPATQGLAKPVNDLSRGCSATDIVGVVVMTAIQAQLAD